MVEYNNRCQYFYVYLALIARDFSIDELKHIFNVTLPQFLKENKEYNQKIGYYMFENKYNWVINKLIKRIHIYEKKWIVFQITTIIDFSICILSQ